MGSKCCHEQTRKDVDILIPPTQPLSTTLGDELPGELRHCDSAGEIGENSIANPIVRFQTHKWAEKCPHKLSAVPANNRCRMMMIKLNTEANVVEFGEKQRQMSLELRDSINCTFLDQLPPEHRRKKSQPEEDKKRNASMEFCERWSADVRAETEVVISLEKRMVICPPPSHFRRENKNVMKEKYEVLGAVGKGSFGEVRQVRERATGRVRAVKIMPKSTCQMTSNFVNEIKILQKLVRANVRKPFC